MYTQLEQTITGVCEQLLPHGYDTTEDDTPELNSYKAICAHYNKTGRILVSSANSEHTIYSDPSINTAFRAWHDYVHIVWGFDFTMKGEFSVCIIQQAQAIKYLQAHGASPEDFIFVIRCLHIEVIEQAKHYFKTGQYVDDQAAFMEQHLAKRVTPCAIA